MSLLQSYTSLSSSSPRPVVSGVLRSVVANGSTFHSDAAAGREMIQILFSDLKACIIDDTDSRLSYNETSMALVTIKELGKSPSGAEVLAEPANLSLLLKLASVLGDTVDASNEALKCIANTLLLNETARATWVSLSINGGEVCVEILQRAASPERIFLASRILFLCTASAYTSRSFIESLVETKRDTAAGSETIIDFISVKLDDLTNSTLAGIRMSREAMTDLLKFTFNLLVHYPKFVDCEIQSTAVSEPLDGQKVMGDYWSPRLDGILPALLRAFNTLPLSSPSPMVPPMTHIIHALITIPISPSSRFIWFGKSPSSSPHLSQKNCASSGASNTSSIEESGGSAPNITRESNSPSCSKESRAGPLDRALSSVLSAGRRSFSRSSSPRSATISSADTVLRAYTLLDVSLGHYLPGIIDPDDGSVRDRCKREGEATLDELINPLAMLLARFCLGDSDVRTRLRQWLIPTDLDRTSPLERRADLLGRCLRLLGSVYHTRVKDAIGEMLYAMCDSDATTLSGYVGYGNVAGFLYHKGVVSAPTSVSSCAPTTTLAGEPINPITGTVEKPVPEGPSMTDEEKELEAERLFILFDRLEKSGALPASQNPIRKAMEKQAKTD
ncbi:guanine nucleotide exchange factor [Hygrophoropsis aurantiaca]|uniref:Guanine nucleotide exchange factor n=1 Tax=Hygrophoropsis aurantiaca TaxID=72124 RepID=A0ACB8AGW5_9AGAM|nr:guanine nucleotide exchange factor [Hygrophoropsis aurantiaca]